MRFSFGCVAMVASIFLLVGAAAGEPVGGVRDPVLADKSEQAVRFRAAVQAAKDEDNKLEPLPEGVTGEQQRAITIKAYEAAIEIMPHSPWCPALLERVAYLWSSEAVGKEMPRKALAAYQRLEREYPEALDFVIYAMCGEANAYEAMGDRKSALQKWQAILEYQLPKDATPEAVKALAEAQETAGKFLHPVIVPSTR